VVPPGLPAQRMDACVQAAEEVNEWPLVLTRE
jgi:hypothetical protein